MQLCILRARACIELHSILYFIYILYIFFLEGDNYIILIEYLKCAHISFVLDNIRIIKNDYLKIITLLCIYIYHASML